MYLLDADTQTHTRLEDLARAVEHSPHFDMTEWTGYESCGSANCIGGTAEIMYRREHSLPRWERVTEDSLAQWLGLSPEQFHDLCYPYWLCHPDVGLHKSDRALAARVIRNLAVTGVVQWGIVW